MERERGNVDWINLSVTLGVVTVSEKEIGGSWESGGGELVPSGLSWLVAGAVASDGGRGLSRLRGILTTMDKVGFFGASLVELGTSCGFEPIESGLLAEE